MARKRIGELLLERGAITQAQLEEGLALQRQTRQRLGVALIQKGFINEEQLAKVLAEALGIAPVELSAVTPEWAAVHMLRARFCEQHELFPFALESQGGRKQLLVAMSDPLNAAAVEEIEFTTGLKVSARMAPLSQVRAAILRYYHKVDPGAAAEEATVPAALPSAEIELNNEDEVIEGELLDGGRREVTARTALADLVKQREQQQRQHQVRAAPAPKPKGPVDDLSKDLDYLFGVRDEPDHVEQLERKFWVLMRIMARKGLITKEEFLEALGEREGE